MAASRSLILAAGLFFLACGVLAASAADASAAVPQSLFDLLHPQASIGATHHEEVEVEHVTLLATVEKGCRCGGEGCAIIVEQIDYTCSGRDAYNHYEPEGLAPHLVQQAIASCDWTWILTGPAEVSSGISRGGSATATCSFKSKADDCGFLCEGLTITAQGTRFEIDQVAFPASDPAEVPTLDAQCARKRLVMDPPRAGKPAAVSTANAPTSDGFVVGGAHVFVGTFYVTSPRHSFKFSTGEMTYVCARFGATTPFPTPPLGVPVLRLGSLGLKFVKSAGEY